MDIVIRISAEKYKKIIDHYDTFPADFKEWGLEAIKNGTPLRQNHGKIIDVSEIQEIRLEDSLTVMTHHPNDEIDCYIDAPAIIEAAET